MIRSAEFLSSYPVLKTTRLDEARHAVARKYCDHRLDLVRGVKLNVVHNHVRGRHISLNHLGYGGDVRIQPGKLEEFYLLQIPLQGAARVWHRSQVIDATRERATLLNPDRDAVMEWQAGCKKLMLQVNAGFLQQVAAEETGMELPGPVRFDPAVEFAGDPGKRLKLAVVGAARAVESGHLPLVHSGQQTLESMSVERDLVRLLLELQPSNISHLLNRTRPAVSSLQIRRAIDFIHACYFEEICVEDIARAAGAHVRTLQTGFKAQTGQSPMGFLKSVRLDIARYRLSQRVNRESVTDVAFGCGYTHLGRFAQDFKARFGHLPSET